MHMLSLRSMLFSAATAAARRPGAWDRSFSAVCHSKMGIKTSPLAVRQGCFSAHKRLHALAPLLDQNSPNAAVLSGEVCSLRCQVFDIPNASAEDLADILMAHGAQSVSIEEFRPEGQPEQEIFVADNSAAEQLWDRCTVVAYFPPEADALKILDTVKCDCGLDHHHQSIEEVRQQDWEESIRVGSGVLHSVHSSMASLLAWHSMHSMAVNTATLSSYQDSYQPTLVEPGLWIVPIWCTPPEPSATNIVLEPGLAFGTGDHPTTRLCLRWLKQLPLTGRAVMDYGTGSGVLAVAALLLGAEAAVGTDVEPLSITAAQANAAHNGVAPRLAVYRCLPDVAAAEPLEQAGVAESGRTFDVVVANILQGPLLSLAPRLAAYAKPGAALGLSGILAEQVPAVRDAYSPFFQGFDVQQEEQWALVTATRKGG